jgi:hypothetical protein
MDQSRRDMPQAIPAGLTREHVLHALADLDAGLSHPIGSSAGVELVHDARRYDPKAVIGVACRHSIGRMLRADEFSDGEAPGEANFVLRRLGFRVVKKDEPPPEQARGRDWTDQEVRLIVADYFAMLQAEAQGQPYKKSEHRKALIPRLEGRSEASVEFKHANVSGVLVDMGLPYIDGYKPRSNYQASLAAEVDSFLDARPGFLEHLAAAPSLNPTKIATTGSLAIRRVIEDPPEAIPAAKRTAKPWLSRKALRIDFAERDAANRQLGMLGEQLVLDLERHRLNEVGRDDLAKKVVWASREIGDGLGFDILSFDEADESERMLEVKATGQGKYSPFYVTSTEVQCSADIPSQYQLFRVFHLGKDPRLFILHGDLKEHCRLQPVLYMAVI